MPTDLTAYTHALFNGDNRMRNIGEDIGEKISEQVYGMAQAKAKISKMPLNLGLTPGTAPSLRLSNFCLDT